MSRFFLAIWLIGTTSLASTAAGGNNADGSVRLSWNREGTLVNRNTVPQEPFPLFLVFENAPDIREVAVSIIWRPVDSLGCYHFGSPVPDSLCGWDDPSPPSGGFDGDSSFTRTILFPPGTAASCIIYEITAGTCVVPKPGDFCLEFVRVRDSNGLIDNLILAGGATILGGTPLKCPRVIGNVVTKVIPAGTPTQLIISGDQLSNQTMVELTNGTFSTVATNVDAIAPWTLSADVSVPDSGTFDLIVRQPTGAVEMLEDAVQSQQFCVLPNIACGHGTEGGPNCSQPTASCYAKVKPGSQVTLPYYVLDCSNCPLENCAIDVTVSPVPNAAGHCHGVSPQPVGEVTGGTTQQGNTGPTGEDFLLTIRLPEFSTRVAVDVGLTPECFNKHPFRCPSGWTFYLCGLQPFQDDCSAGLQLLEPGSGYVLTGGIAPDWHPDHHYGRTNFLSALVKIAQDLPSVAALALPGQPPPAPLHIEDISLMWGGVMDVAFEWTDAAYRGHRIGEEADILVEDESQTGMLYNEDQLKLLISFAASQNLHAKLPENIPEASTRPFSLHLETALIED